MLLSAKTMINWVVCGRSLMMEETTDAVIKDSMSV